MRQKLSALVITWNEAHNIRACLEAARPLADELLVLDMQSPDGTAQIARELGARVLEMERVPFVEPARVPGIRAALHDLVLILDADEILSEGLRQRIAAHLEQDDFDVLEIPRANFALSGFAPHESGFPEYLPRVIRRTHMDLDGYAGVIHTNIEVLPGARIVRIEGRWPDVCLMHITNPTVTSFVSKINSYTSTEAQQRPLPEFTGLKALLLLLRPLRTFWVHLWHRRGIKDGWRGFWLSFLFLIYEALVLMKQWERNQHQGAFPDDEMARVKMRQQAGLCD